MGILKPEVYQSLQTPFISDENGFARFKKDLQKAEAGDDEAAARLSLKAFGYFVEPHRAVRKEGATTKSFESVSGTRRSILESYRSWFDEITVDMDWMAAFRMTSTAGVGSQDIVDFTSTITVKKHDDGAPIEMSKFGSDSRTRLSHERWATGLPFLRVWIEANDLYTLNDAMEGMRSAFMAKKADEAYTALGVAGANTTTVTAATQDAIITGLNSAAKDLLSANSNNGYDLSAQTPLLLYSAIDHQDTILQLFERTSAGDGAGIRPRFRIVPVFTFNSNFPSQITASKDSVNLILPGRKVVWNSFGALRTAQEMEFSTDSINLMAQEYWNKNVPDTQVQTLNLET